MKLIAEIRLNNRFATTWVLISIEGTVYIGHIHLNIWSIRSIISCGVTSSNLAAQGKTYVNKCSITVRIISLRTINCFKKKTTFAYDKKFTNLDQDKDRDIDRIFCFCFNFIVNPLSFQFVFHFHSVGGNPGMNFTNIL